MNANETEQRNSSQRSETAEFRPVQPIGPTPRPALIMFQLPTVHSDVTPTSASDFQQSFPVCFLFFFFLFLFLPFFFFFSLFLFFFLPLSFRFVIHLAPPYQFLLPNIFSVL